MKIDTRIGFSGKHFLASVFFAALLFAFVIQTLIPVDYDNLGGLHSWLSGSTIKFVNMWLKEGPEALHFTCFENFPSIEYPSLADRQAYVSYPTGSIFFVYSIAKILGMERIDVSFLKHVQVACYGLEAVLFAAFSYMFFSGSRKGKQGERVFFAVSMSFLWTMIPGNAWHLANIYYADQCVILFVMLFLVIEMAQRLTVDKRRESILNVGKALIVFCGSLIDYYFWILAFIAFLIRAVSVLRRKKSLLFAVLDSLWYVVPVFASLALFYWQLSFTENWLELLSGRAALRTGNTKNVSVLVNLLKRFCWIMTGGDSIRCAILAVWFFLLAGLIIRYVWKKGFRNLHPVSDGNMSILMLGTFAPVLQILILKNHSGVHEFSMLKVGWIVVMSLPVFACAVGRKATCISLGKIHLSRFMVRYLCAFLAVAAMLGVPFSAGEYCRYRYSVCDYSLEEILYETMEYDHVCFSFSRQIKANPPESLAVSEKRVYQIQTAEDINTLIPNLSEDAEKVLVIDWEGERSDEQKQEEEALYKECEVMYEDERYCLVIVE